MSTGGVVLDPATAPTAPARPSPERGASPALFRGRTLALALWGLGVTFLVLALVEAALLYPSAAGPTWVLLLFPGYALLYAAAGLLASWRRPSNGFGALVVFAGLLILAAGLLNVDPAYEFLVVPGMVLSVAIVAAVLHLLLAFPSGRLGGPLERALVITMYFAATVLQAPSYMLVALPAPFDLFQIDDDPDLANAWQWVQNGVGAVCLGAAAAVMVRRLRAADHRQRRTLGLVTLVGICTILFIPLSYHLAPRLGFSALQLFVAQVTALGVVPVVFVLSALFGGFARTGGLDELGARLGAGDATREGLRNGVAAAIGDPSLELYLRDPDGEGYVDGDGNSADPEAGGASRGVVDVVSGGQSVGAITYDAVLQPNREVVDAAGRVLAIALDRERLIGELGASRQAVRESRERIVLAGDRERRRVERNLHDGAQQRLTGLALLLRMAGDRAADDPELRDLLDEAAGELAEGMTELRSLARGLHPAILSDAGLAAALDALADRSPVEVDVRGCPAERLPEQVEVAAYYVVAEALANAAKHSGASKVTVSVEGRDGALRVDVRDDGRGGAEARPGSGLEGLRDRVEAVGGQLRLHSPAGAGTRLQAELPCG